MKWVVSTVSGSISPGQRIILTAVLIWIDSGIKTFSAYRPVIGHFEAHEFIDDWQEEFYDLQRNPDELVNMVNVQEYIEVTSSSCAG